MVITITGHGHGRKVTEGKKFQIFKTILLGTKFTSMANVGCYI